MLAKLQLSIEHAKWLEAVRKIPCELAAEMGVVSKGENIAFEFRQNGVPSFIKVRKEIIENGSVSKTFWIEPKAPDLCLWNEDCLNEPSAAPLVITEGEFDALSFLAAGATHVVSVPNGAGLDKPGEGEIVPSDDKGFRYLWDEGKLKPGLQRFTKIVIATDDDHKGRILRDELAVRLGRTRCWFVTYPKGCKDANEVLVAHGADALSDVLAEAFPVVPNRLVSFSKIPSRAELPRYSSGWPGLDQNLMIVPPELVVVTGTPGAGKSQWTLALCANLARLHGLRGAILQFEDKPDRNRKDLLRYARSWKGQEKNGIADEPEVWVDRMFKTIAPAEHQDEDTDFNLQWLRTTIEEAATRHSAKWVLVDPWNEVEHVWRINETETGYTNQALRELKRLTRRFQIALIIVTHPSKVGGQNKGVENMSLYDISGSAAWKNKADHGIIVSRESANAIETYIKIDKSKDFETMGIPGVVRMKFAPHRASFDFVGTGT